MDADPGDGECATAGGACTLRAAIREANALPGPDTIDLPAGTYAVALAGAADTIIDGNEIDRVLDILYGARVDITGVTTQGGKVPSGEHGGGGIANKGVLTLSRVVVTNNTVNGTTSGDVGGGISPGGSSFSTLVIVDSTISHNSADRGGGVFFNATLLVTNTLFYSNTARHGGGLNNYGSASLTNVTFSDNNGTDNGGGIRNNGRALLTNCTLFDNVSPVYGGIIASEAVTLTNTIVAHNVDYNCWGDIASGGHNLDSANTCRFSAPGDLLNTDPKLGPLADNGGSTKTHALLPGSPAIDAGTNTRCPGTDQRGVLRPIDGNRDGNAVCDIGAYEKEIAHGVLLPLILK